MNSFARISGGGKTRVLAIGLVWALLAVAGCPIRAKRPDKPTGIILITIDTLRADHLGCYGYPRPTSPFIDGLAREGVQFDRAFAASATTSPSHASLLTGLYPPQHGVLSNNHQLSGQFLTLAEILQQTGFQTAGIVSTRVHFRDGRMDQGFDYLDQAPEYYEHYRPAPLTVDRAINWLDGRKSDDPFFLWVHLFDPHVPYAEEGKFPRMKRRDAAQFLKFLRERHYPDSSFFNSNLKAALHMMDLYDGEVRLADSALQRLFRRVGEERADSKQETLWIVTSDHGEGLGNHNWLSHGKIYNEQLRVPLIFWFSSGFLAGSEVDDIVEHVDILPTTADLLDIRLDKITHDIQGESLLPLMVDRDARRQNSYAFAQRREFEPLPTEHPDYRDWYTGEQFALQNGRFKYILWTNGDDELYDMERDPFELENLINTGLPEEEELRTTLLEKVESLTPKTAIPKVTPDQETRDRLRALGYLP